MISVAWLLNIPGINKAGFTESTTIIDNYNLVITFFIMMNLILSIGSHLKREVDTGTINLIRSKFGDKNVLTLYSISYLFFYFCFNLVPAYSAAFVQQYLNNPSSISLKIFVAALLSEFLGYGFIWTLLTVYLIFYRHSETKIIIMMYAVILFISLINIPFGYKIIDMNWIYGMYLNGIVSLTIAGMIEWLTFAGIAIILLANLSKNIRSPLIYNTFNRSYSAKLLNKVKLQLSAYHLSMLGLETQKMLVVFLTAFAVILYLMLKIKGADFNILAKIFLGGIIPVAFSFNQLQIFTIDQDAHNFNNILLKRKPYYSLILNRWALILLPQILIVSIYFVSFWYAAPLFNTGLFLYLIGLNLLCGSLNLLLNMITKKNGIANILVLIIFYLPLRSDIQNLLNRNNISNILNIFSPLIQVGNTQPAYSQIGVLGVLILIIVIINGRMLNRKYNARNI